MRILVVGASGYVGGRLAPLLAAQGYDLRLASRDPRGLQERFPEAEVVRVDLLDPGTLGPALEGVDTAYYLAHSMAGGESGFEMRDLRAARWFGQAAREAGVRHIVYLGGLGDPESGLSPHLASRQETGAELAAHGVPVTEFRAAIIIGSGSASFELLRSLVEHLPVMITPRWVRTLCQPIAVRDVLDYLRGAAGHPERAGVVEIGGPDVLSYAAMMHTYARLRGMRRLMIPVPVLTPRLSSYWCNLVTPVPASIARPLIEGLRNEVVVRDPGPAQAFDVRPMSFERAVGLAIERIEGHGVETTWFDSLDLPGRPELADEGSREGMIMDHQRRRVRATPTVTFAEIERLGGSTGWPFANPLWRLRGLMDRLVGGPGMRLGRRDPAHVRVGDAVDFWRVEAVRRPELLRLRAEMKVPGRAWLQYEIVDDARGGSLVAQTAFFEPKGLSGLVYWYLLLPAHLFIFRGSIRELVRRAEQSQQLAGRAAGRSRTSSDAGDSSGRAGDPI
ncbi:MAG: SDR family oxidoreductase [Chloroflexota bacterium]|jgi:uncharacterized protein YbjT (DUF2867 family)